MTPEEIPEVIKIVGSRLPKCGFHRISNADILAEIDIILSAIFKYFVGHRQFGFIAVLKYNPVNHRQNIGVGNGKQGAGQALHGVIISARWMALMMIMLPVRKMCHECPGQHAGLIAL